MKYFALLIILILACESSDDIPRSPTGNNNPVRTASEITLTLSGTQGIDGTFTFVSYTNSGFNLEYLYSFKSQYYESLQKTFLAITDFNQSQSNKYVELFFYADGKAVGTSNWENQLTGFGLYINEANQIYDFGWTSGSTTITEYGEEGSLIKGSIQGQIYDYTLPNAAVTISGTFSIERYDDVKIDN